MLAGMTELLLGYRLEVTCPRYSNVLVLYTNNDVHFDVSLMTLYMLIYICAGHCWWYMWHLDVCYDIHTVDDLADVDDVMT